MYNSCTLCSVMITNPVPDENGENQKRVVAAH
jgi:hypothetical protein